MATTAQEVKALREQVAQMQAMLEQLGVVPPDKAARPEERSDYIAFGSEEHATFLGLIEVKDLDAAKEDQYTFLAARESDRHFRLADEMAAIRMMRPIEPTKAIKLVLRQKINCLESGIPQPPPDAPAIFSPPGMHIYKPSVSS